MNKANFHRIVDLMKSKGFNIIDHPSNLTYPKVGPIIIDDPFKPDECDYEPHPKYYFIEKKYHDIKSAKEERRQVENISNALKIFKESSPNLSGPFYFNDEQESS